MSQMLKRNMELQEEIFAKEKVANIHALEHKMEEGGERQKGRARSRPGSP